MIVQRQFEQKKKKRERIRRRVCRDNEQQKIVITICKGPKEPNLSLLASLFFMQMNACGYLSNHIALLKSTETKLCMFKWSYRIFKRSLNELKIFYI